MKIKEVFKMMLDKKARAIVIKSMKREHSRSRVASLYGISLDMVESYLLGMDGGTINARKVIRVEIARLAAEKRGDTHFKPTDKDRYKGTREY